MMIPVSWLPSILTQNCAEEELKNRWSIIGELVDVEIWTDIKIKQMIKDEREKKEKTDMI